MKSTQVKSNRFIETYIFRWTAVSHFKWQQWWLRYNNQRIAQIVRRVILSKRSWLSNTNIFKKHFFSTIKHSFFVLRCENWLKIGSGGPRMRILRPIIFLNYFWWFRRSHGSYRLNFLRNIVRSTFFIAHWLSEIQSLDSAVLCLRLTAVFFLCWLRTFHFWN